MKSHAVIANNSPKTPNNSPKTTSYSQLSRTNSPRLATKSNRTNTTHTPHTPHTPHTTNQPKRTTAGDRVAKAPSILHHVQRPGTRERSWPVVATTRLVPYPRRGEAWGAGVVMVYATPALGQHERTPQRTKCKRLGGTRDHHPMSRLPFTGW